MTLAVPYRTTPLILALLAYSHDRDKTREVLSKLVGLDPVAALAATLLLIPRAQQITIVSPWIEDLVLHLPPPLAHLMGEPTISLTRLMTQACRNKARIEVRTRSGYRDQHHGYYGRNILASRMPDCAILELDPRDRIHTKKVEVKLENTTITLVLTANLTEPEVLKLRTRENELVATVT